MSLNSVGSANGIQTNINNMVGHLLSETFSEIENVNHTIEQEGGNEADKLTYQPTLENIYKGLIKAQSLTIENVLNQLYPLSAIVFSKLSTEKNEDLVRQYGGTSWQKIGSITLDEYQGDNNKLFVYERVA